MGRDEVEPTYLLHYHKVGDTWMLTGIQHTNNGAYDEKQIASYDKLLLTPCK